MATKLSLDNRLNLRIYIFEIRNNFVTRTTNNHWNFQIYLIRLKKKKHLMTEDYKVEGWKDEYSSLNTLETSLSNLLKRQPSIVTSHIEYRFESKSLSFTSNIASKKKVGPKRH